MLDWEKLRDPESIFAHVRHPAKPPFSSFLRPMPRRNVNKRRSLLQNSSSLPWGADIQDSPRDGTSPPPAKRSRSQEHPSRTGYGSPERGRSPISRHGNGPADMRESLLGQALEGGPTIHTNSTNQVCFGVNILSLDIGWGIANENISLALDLLCETSVEQKQSEINASQCG